MQSTRNGTHSKPDDAEHPLPPHDRNAERALLGSMMRSPDIISEAIPLLRPNEFHVFAHTAIYHAIIDVHHGGGGVDVVTVANRIIQQNLLAEIGGAAYLADLSDAAPSAANFRQYASIIREHAKRRTLLYAVHELGRRIHDPAITTAELLADLQRYFGTEPATETGYRFSAISSAMFMAMDYKPTWLLKRLLVKGQPCILGGPKKVLKTTTIIDLALSLGSATPFLGEFTTYKKSRTVVISGESGPHTIQETALRIAKDKDIDLAAADVFWDFRLPQMANDLELAELGRGLRDCGAEVVIVDPLYLALLAGQHEHGEPGKQASNLYDMGPLLLKVSETCLSAGVTPILAHHAKKSRPNLYDPLDLDDLSFSGVAEFARQWLLLSRREAYDPGSGIHRLWFSAGGSIGHGGLWALDIDEGQLNDDFSGRKWDVNVQAASEHIATKVEAKDANKSEANAKRKQGDDTNGTVERKLYF